MHNHIPVSLMPLLLRLARGPVGPRGVYPRPAQRSRSGIYCEKQMRFCDDDACPDCSLADRPDRAPCLRQKALFCMSLSKTSHWLGPDCLGGIELQIYGRGPRYRTRTISSSSSIDRLSWRPINENLFARFSAREFNIFVRKCRPPPFGRRVSSTYCTLRALTGAVFLRKFPGLLQ